MREALMPRYVIDASVAVKWYSRLGEEELEKADLLLDGHTKGELVILAPTLISYELANALRFNPNLGEADVLRASQDFHHLGIELVDLETVRPAAIQLAFQRDLTVYDAVYLAVSENFNIPLVTADLKLYEQTAHLPSVLLLTKL